MGTGWEVLILSLGAGLAGLALGVLLMWGLCDRRD